MALGREMREWERGREKGKGRATQIVQDGGGGVDGWGGGNKKKNEKEGKSIEK